MGAMAKCFQDPDTQLWHIVLRSGDGYPTENPQPSKEQQLELTTDELLATFQAAAHHAKDLMIDFDNKGTSPDVRPDQSDQTEQSSSSSAIAPDGA